MYCCLRNVDFVAANFTADAISTIKILKPDIITESKINKTEVDITGKIVVKKKKEIRR